MAAITLKAHFDGEHIVLDEEFDLAPDSQLVVTVLPTAPDELNLDRAGMAELAAEALSRAYGDDEPEYDLTDIRRSDWWE